MSMNPSATRTYLATVDCYAVTKIYVVRASNGEAAKDVISKLEGPLECLEVTLVDIEMAINSRLAAEGYPAAVLYVDDDTDYYHMLEEATA